MSAANDDFVNNVFSNPSGLLWITLDKLHRVILCFFYVAFVVFTL